PCPKRPLDPRLSHLGGARVNPPALLLVQWTDPAGVGGAPSCRARRRVAAGGGRRHGPPRSRRPRPRPVRLPLLRERVPDDVWRARPTVIIHPGPVGDRGPSSLDW